MRLVGTADEVRQHAASSRRVLNLADDDEVGGEGVADREQIAERALAPQDRRVANHGQPAIGTEPEHGRVGQRLGVAIEIGVGGLVVEQRHRDAYGRRIAPSAQDADGRQDGEGGGAYDQKAPTTSGARVDADGRHGR